MKTMMAFLIGTDDGYRIVNADPATILNTIKASN